MYLSYLQFYALDRKARNTIKDAYHLHAALMKAFPADYQTPANPDARMLFRQEPEQRNAWVSVLVQSPLEPNWAVLHDRFQQALNVKCKLLNLQFNAEQLLRFRLRANPTVTKSGQEKDGHSKRHGLSGEQAQREWLARKAGQNGFALQTFTVVDEGFLSAFKKKAADSSQKHRLAVHTVRYEGLLCVKQPDVFLNEAIKKGIGPAKGLGCGLLSLARA